MANGRKRRKSAKSATRGGSSRKQAEGQGSGARRSGRQGNGRQGNGRQGSRRQRMGLRGLLRVGWPVTLRLALGIGLLGLAVLGVFRLGGDLFRATPDPLPIAARVKAARPAQPDRPSGDVKPLDVLEAAPQPLAQAQQEAMPPRAHGAVHVPAPAAKSAILPDSPGAIAATALPPTVRESVMTEPAWLRNAVAFTVPPRRKMIAVVLDDVGVAESHAEMAIALPPAVTLSFMTYAEHVDRLAAKARAQGHELLVHMPMEPLDNRIDPGQNALLVGMSDAEIRQRIRWGLARFSGYIGINNHMGSRFTQNESGMRVVLDEMRKNGLLFLDSKTIAHTVSDNLAAEMHVTHIDRDVFIDDDLSSDAAFKQLALAEKIAEKQGYAVAIGHPHPATIAALRAWIPTLESKGLVLVPLSAIVRQREGLAG